MVVQEDLIERLRRITGAGSGDIIVSRAPGRVEVLGNHTDYNGGAVLAATIERYVWSVGTKSNGHVRLHSVNYRESQNFDTTDIGPANDKSWHDYIRGVYWAYQRRGLRPPAVTVVIDGDVPIGAGLSSSAALEVSFANLLNETIDTRLTPREIALVAYEAERIYCGIACGVMDQFTSQLCQRNSVLGIYCATLETENVPLSPDVSMVIIDSMVSRAAGEALNTRRDECAEALQTLVQNGWQVSTLTDIAPEQLVQAERLLDDRHAKRVRHVVMEHARVLQAMMLLRENRMHEFGHLMYLSHNSSRDLYEVSHPRLDLLVDIASRQKDVIGSRLTGAGLGGAVLAFVKRSGVELFERTVSKEYERETGIEPRTIVGGVPGGAYTWRV